MALLHLMSYFFFPYQSPSWPLCSVFDAISSNIHEVLSMNPSANVFVFAWYEEAPPIFRASGSPPLAFQDHSAQKVSSPLQQSTSLDGHGHFLCFFQTSRF